MKWIVCALAALNLGYLGYQLTAAEPGDSVRARQRAVEPESGPRHSLVLLAELGGQTLRRRRPAATTDAVVATREISSESAGSAAPGEAAASSLPATTADEPERRCFTIGPLHEAAPVEALSRWFDSRGIEVQISALERREVDLYWVFFPPFPSRDEAVARAMEMREKGIADIYVLRKGDMAHAVSLGAFSRQDTLERRVRDLRAKGYQPATTRRSYATQARWIDIGADALQEMDFRKSFRSVHITARTCEPSELENPSRTAQSS